MCFYYRVDMSPTDRLKRMEEMFEFDRGVLVEDYQHFTGIILDASTPRSKGRRRLAVSHALPSQAQS
jgi:hypothetical protein